MASAWRGPVAGPARLGCVQTPTDRERGCVVAVPARIQGLAIYDPDSGEYAPVVEMRRRYAYPSGSFRTFSDEAAQLLPFGLSGLEWNLFVRLLITHSAGKFEKVVIAEIAAAEKSDPANVSRALALLVETGAVLKGEKDGRSYCYMINPLLGFRGPGVLHHQVFNAHARPLADPATVARARSRPRPKRKEAGS